MSLTAFSDRRPDVALELLAGTRAELSGRFEDQIDSMAALLMAFSGRPAAALAQAERVLATGPERIERDSRVERPRHGVGHG